MIWDKLVDRCLLFTDAPGGLLKELLKEAEIQLSHSLELYESLYTIEVPNTVGGGGLVTHTTGATFFDNNYFQLPPEYIRDISVMHEGTKLKKITENEIYRSSNSNVVPAGTPTGYAISGEYIVFNRTPKQGDKFLLHYKESMTERSADKLITILSYVEPGGDNARYVVLNTELATELHQQYFDWERQNNVQLNLLNPNPTNPDYNIMTGVPGIPDKGESNNIYTTAQGAQLTGTSTQMAIYTVAADLGKISGSDYGTRAANGILGINGTMMKVKNYRKIAPIIPNRFHISLCDYAVALANAKSSPEMYNNYWTKWTMNMDNLTNEAMDRDLLHSIKEEI